MRGLVKQLEKYKLCLKIELQKFDDIYKAAETCQKECISFILRKNVLENCVKANRSSLTRIDFAIADCNIQIETLISIDFKFLP